MPSHHENHLLLVEDDPTQRELVRKALHQAGYRVSEANGLDAANRLLDDDTLSLVVSDFKLADGDGLQVLAEVPAPPGAELHPGYRLRQHRACGQRNTGRR